MKTPLCSGQLLLVLLLGNAVAHAQPASAPPPATQPSLPTEWDPPVSDSPAQRMGGAARGDAVDPTLYVAMLAPEKSVGLTATSRPILYWYLSKSAPYKIEISLRPLQKEGAVKDIGHTILDVQLDANQAAGLHAFDLANPPGGAAPVTLEPEVEYKWVVEVLVHRADGSSDPTGECRIMRVAQVPDLTDSKDPPQRYAALLKAGIWYDALATLNGMIEKDKTNPGLLETRRRLLRKQGLLAGTNGSIEGAMDGR